MGTSAQITRRDPFCQKLPWMAPRATWKIASAWGCWPRTWFVLLWLDLVWSLVDSRDIQTSDLKLRSKILSSLPDCYQHSWMFFLRENPKSKIRMMILVYPYFGKPPTCRIFLVGCLGELNLRVTCLGAVWRYGYIILYPCRSYELSFMIERVKRTCLIIINCLATEMGTILENSLKLQFVSDDDGMVYGFRNRTDWVEYDRIVHIFALTTAPSQPTRQSQEMCWGILNQRSWHSINGSWLGICSVFQTSGDASNISGFFFSLTILAGSWPFLRVIHNSMGIPRS